MCLNNTQPQSETTQSSSSRPKLPHLKYTTNQTEPTKPTLTPSSYATAQMYTETSRESYLDYTFLSHRELIYTKRTKDPKKIKEYNYDLEQTLNLNLDLLSKMPLTLTDETQLHDIQGLISKIQSNNTKRIELKHKIKETKNSIVNRKQAFHEQELKAEELDARLHKAVDDSNKLIEQKQQYLNYLYKAFKDVQMYIEKLEIKEKNISTQRPQLVQFVKENTLWHQNVNTLEDDIKKLYEQIKEVKKENQIYKEESQLYRQKNPNKDLIRVVEFYRRIIRALQTKIKILKNAFDNMTKTLDYLNLGDIVNFNMRKKDLSTTHYEIDLNDIYDPNESGSFNLQNKVDNLMDFHKILNAPTTTTNTNTNTASISILTHKPRK
jgi:phosphoglycolate phosphatase-like HAD superfamily hydrolase